MSTPLLPPVPPSSDTAAVRAGTPGGVVAPDDLRQFIVDGVRRGDLDGESVLVIVPDATRSGPLPAVFDAIHEGLQGRVRRMTAVVALGTHRPLRDPELDARFGIADGTWTRRYPGVERYNHEWWRPDTFHDLGTLERDEVRSVSSGLLDEAIPVRINGLALRHDAVLIAGPVFPHEVVGFSGGTKYLFPGIGGPEMIDTSHWLSALIGVHDIIGSPGVTPVRALIDRAAALLPARQLCLSYVVADDSSVHGAFFGAPQAAWEAAAQLSAQVHIDYVDRPYRRVLSVVADRYEDLWTAAKGVYKLDPVTADGGEIVLYAPHLREVSTVHGEYLVRCGYHCRDYLLAHLSELSGVPRAVLAHSCHVRGEGAYDPGGGERFRRQVSLATAVPEEACAAVNLGYRDPASIDVDAWRDDPETLVVPHAGERLYRLDSRRGTASPA